MGNLKNLEGLNDTLSQKDIPTTIEKESGNVSESSEKILTKRLSLSSMLLACNCFINVKGETSEDTIHRIGKEIFNEDGISPLSLSLALGKGNKIQESVEKNYPFIKNIISEIENMVKKGATKEEFQKYYSNIVEKYGEMYDIPTL